jgi:hypothetical protein
MAEIVLGIGCAHAPQLHAPVEEWEHHARRDTEDTESFWYKGERVKYAELLERRAGQCLSEQIDSQICKDRIAKSRVAINRISQIFSEVAADVAIIFGNDQGEMFLDDLRPAISIMGCKQFENMPRTAEQTRRLPANIHIGDKGHLPEKELLTIPGHPELARHLVKQAMIHDFDVT